MIDKQKATLLREQGSSYQEIADELGCSLDWCKRNLQGISKNSKEKDAIAQAIVLAQSTDGITNGEIRKLIYSIYPKENTEEYEEFEKKVISRFKVAIRKVDSTVIRPYWMHPQNAKQSVNLMLSAVDNLYMHLESEIDYIRKTLDYDESYDKSIRYALVKLLAGSDFVPEGVERHCENLSNAANKLEVIN